MAERSFKLTSRKTSSGSTTLRGVCCFRRDFSLPSPSGGVEMATDSLIFIAFLCCINFWAAIAGLSFLPTGVSSASMAFLFSALR